MDDLEVKMRFRKLVTKLNALATKDNKFNNSYTYNIDKDTVTINEKTYNKALTIYRKESWYGTGHAVQVKSEHWGIDAKKYRSDLGSAGLANKLHKRVKGLLQELTKEGDDEVANDKRKVLIKAKARELFPLAEEISFGYGNRPNINIRIGGMNINSYDGESFRILNAKLKITKDNVHLLKPFLLAGTLDDL